MDQTRCAGGLFATVYDEDCVTYFMDDAFDDGQIKEYYRNYYQKYIGSLQPRVRTDPQISFEYTFEIEGYEIIQKGEVVNDDEIKITYEDESGENEITLKRVKE